MDIISDYRALARIPSEQELALRAERVRIALERAPQHRHRRRLRNLLVFRATVPAPITGPVTTIPST